MAAAQQCVAVCDCDGSDTYGNIVRIKCGERYRLLNGEANDWWCIAEQNRSGELCAPRRYLKLIENGNESFSNNICADSSDVDYPGRDSPPPDYYEGNDAGGVVTGPSEGVSSFQGASRSPARRTVSLETQTHYANYDAIWANNPRKGSDTLFATNENQYANLAAIQAVIHSPPKPDPKSFVHSINSSWQMYCDPLSKRNYYFNTFTLETTWKPPRLDASVHSFSTSSSVDRVTSSDATLTEGDSEDFSLRRQSDTQTRPSSSLDTYDEDGSSISSGWSEVIDELGTVAFVNRFNDDKWFAAIDEESGQRYYYKDDCEVSSWSLPELPISSSFTAPPLVAPKPDNMRLSKSKSMYVDSQRSSERKSKIQTLPATLSSFQTFTAGIDKPLSNSNIIPTQAFLQSPKDGFLNKAKVLDSGRKVKKNWSQSYVLLTGSNLVFYKDQKSAQSRQGHPHGKPEFIISLHGAKVQLDSQSKSSKKNVIMLTTGSNSQYLLQCEDYYRIQNWFIALNGTVEGLSSGLDIPSLIDESTTMAQTSAAAQGDKPQSKVFTKPISVSRSSSVEVSASQEKTFRIRNRLRQLMSRRPTAEVLKAQGIIKDAVFGAELSKLCERDNDDVPKFVRLCVSVIEDRGLSIDGLYRLSGNVSQVQKLRHMIDQDQLNALKEPHWDIHVLTGTLKLFFRELKEPLFPFECYDKLVSAAQTVPPQVRLKNFIELIHNFPRCHMETIKLLFGHLTKVTTNSNENRMEPHNLAIVFGPTLLWPQVRNSLTMTVSTVYQNRIIELLLLEYNSIF